MKAVVAAFNQEKALVGAFSVITNLRMELFEALVCNCNARLPGHTHSATPGEIFAHVSAGGRLMLAADCNEET